MKEKFQRQNKLYNFPYHYIPEVDRSGKVSLVRKLAWGLEYLCYQLHVREKILQISPKSVLDVGCGDGCLLGMLPDSVKKKLGVDLSEEAIAFARAFNPDTEFLCAGLDSISGSFDVVLAIEVLEHVPDENINSFLYGLSELVKDDGVIILSVPTTNSPLHKKHYRHYTIDLLKSQISSSGASVEITKVEYIYNPPGWIKFFIFMLSNRHFSLEINKITNLIWNKVWKSFRYGDENNGMHLVVEIKKSSLI